MVPIAVARGIGHLGQRGGGGGKALGRRSPGGAGEVGRIDGVIIGRVGQQPGDRWAECAGFHTHGDAVGPIRDIGAAIMNPIKE